MKFFKKILFVNIFLFSSLMAIPSPLIEAEAAIKLVNHKGIKFILVEEGSISIKGSVTVNLKSLYGYDINGNSLCSPFYSCSDTLKESLELMGITNEDELIIYDKSYGVYASTFYSLLESIGHKNIKILNGGYSQIQKLDPNQKSYDEYSADLTKIKALLEKEENNALIKKHQSDIKSLTKILLVLKPLLLVDHSNTDKYHSSHYEINRERFNSKYLLDKEGLENAVDTLYIEGNKSNIVLVDSCNMIDIVGNKRGNYLSGVTSINWKILVDKKKHGLKSKELLEKIFEEAGMSKGKSIYLYCMSGSEKAFYLMTALRLVGYDNIKIFTGNWDVWMGDELE